jgi:hypothetical protein
VAYRNVFIRRSEGSTIIFSRILFPDLLGPNLDKLISPSASVNIWPISWRRNLKFTKYVEGRSKSILYSRPFIQGSFFGLHQCLLVKMWLTTFQGANTKLATCALVELSISRK